MAREAEQRHLSAIRDAKLRRLRVLEVQEAELGAQAPPHVLTELEDLRHDLEDIRRGLESPISKEIYTAMNPDAERRYLMWQVKELQEVVSRENRHLVAAFVVISFLMTALSVVGQIAFWLTLLSNFQRSAILQVLLAWLGSFS